MKSALLIFSCVLTIFIAQVSYAVEANEKIRIFYTAITGEQSIFWIVKESGMLQKYGIDPEMVFIDSGTLALQTMAAGDSHLGMVGSTAVVLSNLSGSGVKMIAGLINNLTYILITDPKITRPEQLKGAKLAVARFGSLSDFGTRLALKKVGVSLSDVTLIQIGGGQPGRFAALKSGGIQGLVVAPISPGMVFRSPRGDHFRDHRSDPVLRRITIFLNLSFTTSEELLLVTVRHNKKARMNFAEGFSRQPESS
jgi:NitT/TauT family transport system substrate-binding protein